MLAGAAAFVILGASVVGCTPRGGIGPLSTPGATFGSDEVLPALQPNGGSITRSLFAPGEVSLAGYAAVFAALANGVVGEPGGTQGFLSGDFWRSPGRTYDARVQENVLTLAWFLVNPRPWNPYADAPELEQRMRAAIGYYLSLQHDDGSFPTSSPEDHNRATTAFALATLASTRDALASRAASADLIEPINAAIERAATWFLDTQNKFVWTGGVAYSNQVIEGLSGLESSRDLLSQERRDAIDTGWQRLNDTGLSAAGHLYEREGVDFTYSMRVALPSLARAVSLSPSPVPGALLASHLDFCGHNYLWEPDRRAYLVNGAAGTRMTTSIFQLYGRVVAEVPPPLLDVRSHSPRADAFLGSADDQTSTATSWLAAGRAVVTPLGTGAVSPHPFLTPAPTNSWPSANEFSAALGDLPYLKSDRFVERRIDSSKGVEFTYVRRPGYYLGLFSGRQRLTEQRMGCGFLYDPTWGTAVLARRDSDMAWGIRTDQFTETRGNLAMSLQGDVDGVVLTGADGQCTRTLTFDDHALGVQLQSSGSFSEDVPLLLRPTDTVLSSAQSSESPLTTGAAVTGVDTFVIQRGDRRMSLTFATPTTITASDRNDDTFGTMLRRRLLLTVEAENELAYTIGFSR